MIDLIFEAIVLVISLGIGIFVGVASESIGMGIVLFIASFCYFSYKVFEGRMDANIATQDIRDREIIEAIRELKE